MRRYRTILAQENISTDEGPLHRNFPTGCFSWRALPLTLRAIVEDFGGHAGAFPIGAIETITREGAFIVAAGFLDDEGTGADADRRRDVIRQIEGGVINGVSVDPGAVEIAESCLETDEDGFCTSYEMRFDRYEIGAATVVPIPALSGTLIELEEIPATIEGILDAVAASGLAAARTDGWVPPAEWFEDPQLAELTRHTVITEDGRVFGHIAGWSDCHISFPDYCQRPWDSACDFAYFHACSVDTTDGERRVGPLAASGGHYPTSGPNAGDYRAAQAAYDDPAACVAYVAVGRDEHGIWYAGALRPDATDQAVGYLRSHQLSGDWRRIGGNMELVAACAVNVPGFVRELAMTASGEPIAAVMGHAPPMAAAASASEPACSCGTKNASNQSGGTLNFVITNQTNAGMLWPAADMERLRKRLAAYDEMFGPQIREHLLAKLRG